MREVNPQDTNRAKAFELWMRSPMPMVTMTKTFDITRLRRLARKRGVKLNMLMCYAIGRAASDFAEFYLLPVGDKLMQFDSLAVNTIVMTPSGDIRTCDIPFSSDIHTFASDYLRLTEQTISSGEEFNLGDDYMVIGTSALTKCELDSVVNLYAGFYNNPFVVWGKYRKGLFRTTLPISFQFHHTQMDGPISTGFLNRLQEVFNSIEY
ncbi:MAG: CatA-like O-acetyltransferase, family 2 [Alistipes sp.]|nr:CatA-like O-acetyltransferase, family 2 [Alistipes sp.]